MKLVLKLKLQTDKHTDQLLRETCLGYNFRYGRRSGREREIENQFLWDAPRVDVWLQVPQEKSKLHTKQTTSSPWGLELYSLRHELSLGVPYLLTEAKSMGFQELELPGLYGMTAEVLRQELDKADLRCSSVVFPYDRYANDLNGIAHDVKTLGAEYALIGWIPHNGAFSPDDAARAIRDFNAWGKALSEQGVQFTYHPHGYEFQPASEGTLFDRMARETDARYVNFEMDVFWIVRPGQDPVALMRKYPTRFPLMHLKDMRKGEPIGDLTGSAPKEFSVALGQGQLDFPAILREAKQIGVKSYYLEDEAPTAAQQLPQSLRYLTSLSDHTKIRRE